MITGEVKSPEPDFSREDYLAKAIVTAFGVLIQSRTNDLPHRFRAPASFAAHMEDWGTNSTYHSIPIMGGNPANIMTIQMTTRPTQKVFEMVFTDASGMRLFTLEIEYGDAIPKTREVLLSWRKTIHKKTGHRNPPRQSSPPKASSFLSAFPGLNWRKISRRHGAELTRKTRNPNPWKYWVSKDRVKPIGFAKPFKSE